MRCAVLGSPIGHSLSPVLHRTAYAELGLHWRYERHEVVESGLREFVEGCDASWRGLSLTMPLKEAALELGRVDPLAELVGAANTLIFAPAGRRLYNTDVGGLVLALRAAGVEQVRSAVILANGATARSSLASLAELGCTAVRLLARTPARAETLRPLAGRVGIELQVLPWDAAVPGSDVVVSTAAAQAADPLADAVAASAPVIFDVSYDPWPTRLAEVATDAGCQVLSGLDLLVHQAVLQVELMTGGTVPADKLLSAGRAELSRRAGA